MRVRAIKDLSQLSDDRLFEELARGMQLVWDNANRLWNDSVSTREQSRHRAAMILRAIAEEEAAKYLILLDAARCPRTDKSRFVGQLSRFTNHLARGLYAEYADARPSTFAEVREFVETERKAHYLDGPNEIDWIFRNQILQRREDLMYVDYVQSDEKHEWTAPCDDLTEAAFPFVDSEPAAIRLTNVLHKAGFDTPEAVAVIATMWRTVELSDDLHWSEYRRHNQATLAQLEEKGLLNSMSPEEAGTILDEWTYPMYSLDLNLENVDLECLRQRQRDWVADQELGF